jgi:hypothetical protein
MPLSYKHIAPFLSAGQNRLQRWVSYIGLGLGILLLLCSLQVYININQLLKDRNPRKDGFDYISVTKQITNENMGQDHSFSDADIKELKSQSFIEDATPLNANKFLVKVTGPSSLPFTTDMFLESINNNFLDTVPDNFTWKEGDDIVPVIMSSDYLELYNTVFAPSKDLPQFSGKTISAVMVQMECYTATGAVKNFRAHVVGLSDRINSVLVPENFLQWANHTFSNTDVTKPSRIFLKIKDANNPAFLDFLQKKNYSINKDKTKFGRIKQVLQAIVSGLSAFGILVIVLAMMLFSFYLQLMIARSKDNLQLLLTLGYSPGWLSKTVAARWIPVYIIVMVTALVLTIFLQYCFQHFAMNGREELSPFIHWSVGAAALLLLFVAVTVNYRMVSRLLHTL